MNILIAENSTGILKNFLFILKTGGYNVVTARKGNECWGLLEEVKPALFIVDLSLTNTDIPALCKKIKADETLKDTYILLCIDSDAGPEKRVAALNAGADSYILAPISQEEFLASVQSIKRITDLTRDSRIFTLFQNSIFSIIDLILHNPKLPYLIGETESIIKNITKADECHLYELNSDSLRDFNNESVQIPLHENLQKKLHSEEPFAVSENDELWIQPSDKQIKSAFYYPALFQNKPLCLLILFSREKKNFSHIEVVFLKTVLRFLTGAIAFYRTSRDLMENKLRSEGIVKSAMDGIITVDEKFNIVMFNSAAEKMFSCKAENVIGKPMDMLLPARFREKHKMNLREYKKTGDPVFDVSKFRNVIGLRSDGEEFPIQASVSKVEFDKRTYFSVVLRDITNRLKHQRDLKISEERYRQLFQKSPLPMWIYDAQTLKFMEVNEAAIKTYGYSNEEFLSMSIKDIRPSEDILVLEKYVAQKRENYVNAGVWKHKKKDGSIINVEISSLKINFGESEGRLVIALDITDRRKSLEDLKSSREHLRALTNHLQNVREEERAAIAREIHDELGQVLTSLKINLTMMGKTLASSSDKVDTPYLLNELDLMKNRIDLSIKKLRKLITELRPEVLDNLGLLAAFEWLCQEFQADTGIECKLVNEAGEISFDKNKSINLFRIFQESLTNVARHAHATRVVSRLKKNESVFIMEISDNGIGITPENLINTKSFGILGIRERVKILGGNIEIGRAEKGGTKVTVTLPMS